MKPCVILIVPSMGYDQHEYLDTRQALEDNNIQVITASTRKGSAVAHHPDSNVVDEQKPTTTHVDIAVSDIDPLSYQGIFLTGGVGALEYLDVHEVHNVLQATRNFDLYYGAIGKACRVLASAGVLPNGKATGWNDDNQLPRILESHGCEYHNEQIIVSGKVITAKSHAASDFGTTIAQHVSWY